jgi:hypothetical protein
MGRSGRCRTGADGPARSGRFRRKRLIPMRGKWEILFQARLRVCPRMEFELRSGFGPKCEIAVSPLSRFELRDPVIRRVPCLLPILRTRLPYDHLASTRYMLFKPITIILFLVIICGIKAPFVSEPATSASLWHLVQCSRLAPSPPTRLLVHQNLLAHNQQTRMDVEDVDEQGADVLRACYCGPHC